MDSQTNWYFLWSY